MLLLEQVEIISIKSSEGEEKEGMNRRNRRKRRNERSFFEKLTGLMNDQKIKAAFNPKQTQINKTTQ